MVPQCTTGFGPSPVILLCVIFVASEFSRNGAPGAKMLFFSAGYGVFHSHGGTENGDFKGKFPSINALFRGIPLFRKPPSQNCSKTVENTYSSSTIFETMISCRFFNPLSPGCLPRILWKHAGQADEQTFLGIRWWRPWVCSKIWGNHAGTIKFLKNKHLRHP